MLDSLSPSLSFLSSIQIQEVGMKIKDLQSDIAKFEF